MSGGKNQRDRSKSARESLLDVSAKTDWKLPGKLGWNITSCALDAENRGLYVGWQALVHNLPFMVYGSGAGTQSAVYGLWFTRL
jgi:beta-lactamase class D